MLLDFSENLILQIEQSDRPLVIAQCGISFLRQEDNITIQEVGWQFTIRSCMVVNNFQQRNN